MPPSATPLSFSSAEGPLALLPTLCAFAAGLVAGTAVRTLAFRYAVTDGEQPRSRCEGCGRRPRMFGVPAVPPNGSCRTVGCERRLGPPAWGAELLTGVVLAALVAATAGRPVLLVGTLCGAAVLGCALGVVDATVRRLPDALTFPLLVGTLLLLGVVALLYGGDWPRAALAALLLGVAYLLLALFAPVGLGDAKLAPTLGAVTGWFGWSVVLSGVVAGFLLSGVYGAALLLLRKAGRKDQLPFGPFLLAGALLAVLAAA